MSWLRCIVMLLCLGPAMTTGAAGAAAAPGAPATEPLDHAICRLIENAAHANHLPVGFVTRVIWRESSFRAAAISPAGAEGIAQFMPGTAQERGLLDPFDPEQAIPKAARLLADLRRQFGNLGAAAAAYNGGPARVANWLRGQGDLPAQTRRYVRLVTLRSAEDWLAPGNSGSSMPNASGSPIGSTKADEPADDQSCVALTAELRRERGRVPGEDQDIVPLAPWGVQLAGNFSKGLALAAFERARERYAGIVGNVRPMIIGRLLRSRGTRPFYQVRLPAPSRTVADALCTKILSIGGNCVAMRS